MKTAIKTVMTSTIAMALISFGANAAEQGQGVVKFEGSVINAPCSIDLRPKSWTSYEKCLSRY